MGLSKKSKSLNASSCSGQFVLRLPQELHASLKKEAQTQQVSLNRLVIDKIQASQEQDQQHEPSLKIIENFLNDHLQRWSSESSPFLKPLLGIILFGSVARGEARADSDIDLLLVVQSSVVIDRALYRFWDDEIAPHLDKPYSPQFAHCPKDLNSLSSLWLEVALEGQVILDTKFILKKLIHEIRAKMALGYYQRRISYGLPYWRKNAK